MVRPFSYLFFLFAAGALLIPSCTKEYLANPVGVCFERDVLPIFLSNCTSSGCHNSAGKQEGCDLTSYETIVSKGITAGNYQESEIFQAITRRKFRGRFNLSRVFQIAKPSFQ